jgi:hypothetical protein
VAAVAKLAEGAAAHDPQGAARLVAGMEDSPARTQAAIALGQKWFPQNFPSDQGVKPEAVAWIRSLEGTELQGQVLEKVAWGWTLQDRDGIVQFLGESGGAHVPGSVYQVVMQTLARADPLRALEWAAGLPEQHVQVASAVAFSTWTQLRPAEALDWMVALPVNDPRRPAMVRTMVTDLSHLAEVAVAVARLGKLAPSDQIVAREQIEKAGIPQDRKQRLLGALKN